MLLPPVDGEELQRQADRFRYEVAELVAASRALSSERDIRKLLALILEKTRQVTGADAGSVYVIDEDPAATLGARRKPEKRLHFMLSQNDSLKIDLPEFTLAVDEKSIVGKAVLDALPINIPDLDRLADPAHNPWGFKHNRSFDEKTGYRARSMLTVPMLSAENVVIGVIQLINKKRDPARALTRPEDFDAEVVPFDARSEEFAFALCSQAGLSLENAKLYEEIKDLFEGFVEASVQAIESRDPTTSGHSRRVATLSVALATRVDGVSAGPLSEVRFSPTTLKQLEYAGVLHDFGKVGVREKVLVKAKKLYEEDLRTIKLRFAYVRKALEAEAADHKLALAMSKLHMAMMQGETELDAHFAGADAKLARKLAELDNAWAFVNKANEPTVLEEGGLERLVEIGKLVYTGPDGEIRPYLEPEEVAALQVRRGSLTDVERVEIESHVVHTYNFLKKIPWGKRFADVPRIAGAHHEYLNGGGYPRHLPAADIPVETRIMTIADIFDALTASDRPYKKAVPIDRALGIIESEVKAGKCDAELFRIFVETQVYKAVL
jgi:HD-GYP domain-containing protein (c-di-GMP phosphodiesterase class II)